MSIEAAATWEAIGSLTEWSDNPRLNDSAVKKVASSMKRFGFVSPIVARKSNREIIVGHTRLKAAKLLGLKTVPVRFLDIDAEEAHILALADNRIGEEASWDVDALKKLLAGIHADDLTLTGFDDVELERYLSGVVQEVTPAEMEKDQRGEWEDKGGSNSAVKPLTIFFARDDFDDVVEVFCGILDKQGIPSNSKALLWLLSTYENA